MKHSYQRFATAHQLAVLRRNNLIPERGDVPDYYAAQRLIDDFVCERRKLHPTPRQEHLLRKKGLWRDKMTRGQACDIISRLDFGECQFS
jgi:hypothetical protein